MAQTEDLTFEQALARLEEIVEQLDSGDLALEQSIKLFEEGMALKALCADRLSRAEALVEQYVGDAADEGDAPHVALEKEEEED